MEEENVLRVKHNLNGIKEILIILLTTMNLRMGRKLYILTYEVEMRVTFSSKMYAVHL